MNKRLNKGLGRLIFTVIAMILVAFAAPAPSYANSLPEYVKVGLFYSSTALDSCTVKCDAGMTLGSAADDGFDETLPLPAYTTLCATVENGAVVLRDKDGVLISSDIGKNGCLMAADHDSGGKITIQDKQYRGGVFFKANSSGKLTVINYIKLEEYLYGVVHLEMSQSNPIEALKAQAVAARSFAVSNLNKHSDQGFDLCNTTNCQSYGGCSAEYANTTKAVDATKGLLIWSDGEPVPVYYYKNSGGHTQNIEDVWSYPLPYLVGVADPYSPAYPWTATLTFDTIAQKLSAAGYNVGTVKSVQITKRNSSGAVSELTIKGTDSNAVLTKETIRTTFGTSLIRSRMFKIGSDYSGENASADMTIKGSAGTAAAGDSIYVLGSAGSAKSLASTEVYITDGKTVAKASSSSSDSGDDEVATDGELVLSGMGYGHGVGMPQDGAIEMAKEGFGFEDILKFYFTGIEIK
jgi:stage II sporulation protein D